MCFHIVIPSVWVSVFASEAVDQSLDVIHKEQRDRSSIRRHFITVFTQLYREQRDMSLSHRWNEAEILVDRVCVCVCYSPLLHPFLSSPPGEPECHKTSKSSELSEQVRLSKCVSAEIPFIYLVLLSKFPPSFSLREQWGLRHAFFRE